MYKLEKYRGLCSRHVCPACKSKRSFVYYVDERNQRLSELVGRCNHESSCGYHYPPREYFRDNPTSNIRRTLRVNRMVNKKSEVKKKMCYIPTEYLERYIEGSSNLFDYLMGLFDDETVDRILDDYKIGFTDDCANIFWQIDINGRVRSGKVQHYDKKTGKRRKDVCIGWVHSALKKCGDLPPDWELSQCLYGEHLLAKYPDKIVAVVEGEKNAIVCSAKYGQCVWVATGSKQGLSMDKMKVLKGRNVVLFPDADAYDDWLEKSKQMTFCHVTVSDMTVENAPDGESGFDVADYVIENMVENMVEV